MKRIRYIALGLVLVGLGSALSFGEQPESPAMQKMAAARKAIEQNPQRYDAYNELALAQARRARETADPKHYEDAQRSLEMSLRLAPESMSSRQRWSRPRR
jgi:hypothetical protein